MLRPSLVSPSTSATRANKNIVMADSSVNYISYVGGSLMVKHEGAEHHKKAAEHHENAAQQHKEAAKQHEAGSHEKAGHRAHVSS
jgi:hypothetical protein